MGLRLNLKWSGLSVQSPLSTTTSSSWTSSYSCRGRDFLQRLSAASVVYGETETSHDTSRAHVCSTSPRSLEENYYLGSRDVKMAYGRGSSDGTRTLLDDKLLNGEDKLAYLTSLQATGTSQYRTLKSSSCTFDLSTDLVVEEEDKIEDDATENRVGVNVVVCSGKKEARRLRRQGVLKKSRSFEIASPLKTTFEGPQISSKGRPLRSRNKRRKFARNESEIASGVKAVAELEKIRKMLEQVTGQIASLSTWAEAAGINKTEFQKQLHHGLRCRDELLRSTRSLVLFIARNYWGLGVAFEDLIQAGNIGVLEGAERFDQTRGYKFSTYVQYWIRKSMSTLVAKHARGIRIPCTLIKVINQVQKARKKLTTSHGKYPDDYEIAKFTGLSLAKITSASKCLRVVGSIDQKVGDCINAKYLEFIPNTSMTSPEEAVIRKHLVKDMYSLLDGLKPREKQVIILRYGLGNYRCKSLDEIGRHFSVSKEWVRRIERSALTKLKNEDSLKLLSHYVYMQ